jgi:hypothetical protein
MFVYHVLKAAALGTATETPMVGVWVAALYRGAGEVDDVFVTGLATQHDSSDRFELSWSLY